MCDLFLSGQCNLNGGSLGLNLLVLVVLWGGSTTSVMVAIVGADYIKPFFRQKLGKMVNPPTTSDDVVDSTGKLKSSIKVVYRTRTKYVNKYRKVSGCIFRNITQAHTEEISCGTPMCENQSSGRSITLIPREVSVCNQFRPETDKRTEIMSADAHTFSLEINSNESDVMLRSNRYGLNLQGGESPEVCTNTCDDSIKTSIEATEDPCHTVDVTTTNSTPRNAKIGQHTSDDSIEGFEDSGVDPGLLTTPKTFPDQSEVPSKEVSLHRTSGDDVSVLTSSVFETDGGLDVRLDTDFKSDDESLSIELNINATPASLYSNVATNVRSADGGAEDDLESGKWKAIMEVYALLENQLDRFPWIAGCSVSSDGVQVVINVDQEIQNASQAFELLQETVPENLRMYLDVIEDGPSLELC